MQRAYLILDTKDFDDEKRRFKGVASTPNPDRMNDIVEPKGAHYTLPVTLLSQHEHHMPIGHISKAVVTDKHIEVEGEIVRDSGLDYVDIAWKQIRAGLVRGLSIGFRALEYAFMDNGGIHFKEWEWIELSAVTIPANADCTLATIKSFDQDPVKRSQVIHALSERNLRLEQAKARIERAKQALSIRT
jgi:HK97 family phage prohead protease